jgi:Asp-tRNA(Asn)/Glu-tRNA(Gln) amidotransferase A subunit family amidase
VKSKLRSYLALGNEMGNGRTTPRAYLDETLDRIKKLDATIGAFVMLADESRLKSAADASTARWKSGKPLSAVDGMPVAIKDIIETADMPTGQGSPLFEGTMSRRDSATVYALREAGAIIIGKTTTTEFAASHPWHTTKNPHDPVRTPGGSSSGSAAAVGCGMVPAGLGSQVVGSILRPASFCGAVGYKPSLGGLNRSGSHDHFSQSCAGVLAASIADTWAVTKAIAERAGGDPGFIGVTGGVDFRKREKPKRLAFIETGGWKVTSENACKAFEAAKEQLAKAGIEIRSRKDDADLDAAEKLIDDAQPLTLAINAWEGRWPLNTYHELGAARLSPSAQERYQTALTMSQAEYAGLIERRAAARAAYAKAIARYDACVTLGACGAAPMGLKTTGNTAMNVGASLLGVPALTLPVLADEGMPLGLQFLGRIDEDAALFGVASGVLAIFDRHDVIGASA